MATRAEFGCHTNLRLKVALIATTTKPRDDLAFAFWSLKLDTFIGTSRDPDAPATKRLVSTNLRIRAHRLRHTCPLARFSSA
jgi:hypothetical protein